MVHVETQERHAQSTQAQRQDSLAQSDLAVSLRSSLELLLHGDMARLFQGVGTFDVLLVIFTKTCPDRPKIDHGRNGSLRE